MGQTKQWCLWFLVLLVQFLIGKKCSPLTLRLSYACVDLQFHVQAVLSVLLATFAGFGVTMCGNSFVVEFLKWRRRWLAGSDQQHSSQEVTQMDGSPGTANPPQTGSPHHETEMGNSGNPRGS